MDEADCRVTFRIEEDEEDGYINLVGKSMQTTRRFDALKARHLRQLKDLGYECDPDKDEAQWMDAVAFLKEVGTKKVQLTFFGGKMTTDKYVGRKGAYQELMEATKILLRNGITPRWQFFINMENKEEILPQIKMGETMGVKEIFVHEGSCDGNNAKLYGIHIEKEAIPKELIPYYLDYGNRKSTRRTKANELRKID